MFQYIQQVVDHMSNTKVAFVSTMGAGTSLTMAFSASDLTFWMQVAVLFFALVGSAGSALLAWMKVARWRKNPDARA